jgi:ABC-type transport system involved in multi-copper enzyme maturation permease subunit
MPGNLSFWLTPLWFLSVGVTLGAAVLVVLYGLLWLVSRPAAAAVLRTVQESVLQWISYVVLVYVALCFLATPMMPWRSVIDSVRRLPYVGTKQVTVTIPPRTDDLDVEVEFQSDELQRYSVSADQDVIVGVEPRKAYSDPLIEVVADEPYAWTPSSKFERKFSGPITSLYVTNHSDAPTELTIETTTDVPIVESRQIFWTAAAVVGVYLIYLLQTWLLPRLSAVALATAKEAVGQPLYLLALFGGMGLLLLYVYIPYNTFGEDVKMYKDSSLTTIMVLAILVAMWTASVSVADEIEGRTALTLLSKPISRRQFVLGKFIGIVWPIFLMYVVLGAWMLIWVSYKVVYDARETSNPDPTWQLCNAEMVSAIPGLVLAFLETVVLAAISVAISTRLPMLPNLVICGAIYALGHLGPLIVQSSAGQNEFVAFFGKFIPLIVPVLDHFNIQAAVAGGVPVPPTYLLWALLYCVLYSAAMMLLALILFEDRDLA